MKKELRTCERCGMQFYVERTRARITTCPECPIITRKSKAPGNTGNRTRGHPTYDMALELVTLRLAFEMIEPLIKLGRRLDAEAIYMGTKDVLERQNLNSTHIHSKSLSALEILVEVEAPARGSSIINLVHDQDEIDYHALVMLEAQSESRTRGQ